MRSKASVTRRTIQMLVAVALLSLPLGLSAQEPESPTPSAELLDINTATAEQLTRVVMDEEVAQRIIENRPFANKRQLVSRDLVSEEEYERIKDRIVARRVSSEP
jgi:DNA uptake protein ComE-like DNA-binding protein